MDDSSKSSDRVHAVKLTGEIDLSVSTALEERLGQAISEKPSTLVIDLREVTYIDSSGLAVLIDTLQKLKKQGGALVLEGLQDPVRKVFRIARLDQVFEIR